MRAVIFDLDGTLYPELEFVRSGFREVARYLDARYHLGEARVLDLLLEKLRAEGRGRVFDGVLRELGVYTEERVRLLLFLYRSHRPEIRLHGDVLPTLEELGRRGVRLGLVTDGMASVQRRKIAALGLEGVLDAIVCSDELGGDCWKPSAVPYRIALDLLGAAPLDAAYVGDDVRKDFLWPNSAGMLTIEVRREVPGGADPRPVPEASRARAVVSRLEDILPLVEGSVHAR